MGGLRTADGTDVDEAMDAAMDAAACTGGEAPPEEAVRRSAELLALADRAEEVGEEMALTMRALELRRWACHPLSTARCVRARRVRARNRRVTAV